MYAHFDGILAEKNADSVVIDCGGVGYQLQVSSAALNAAPQVGARFKCFAHLSVREDALELFGFYSREEKAMFLRLNSVTGIGPRTALAILSALSVRELTIALLTGDAASLARAPGIGKKTAQRLILELRDKIDGEAELTGQTVAPIPRGGPMAEAIEALMALGYASSEAAQAVARVASQTDRTDELIRLALKGMNG
jgi:Holliday junction DNA helicase RuvA